VAHANVITRVDPTSSINSGGTNESDREKEKCNIIFRRDHPPEIMRSILYRITIKHYFSLQTMLIILRLGHPVPANFEACGCIFIYIP